VFGTASNTFAPEATKAPASPPAADKPAETVAQKKPAKK